MQRVDYKEERPLTMDYEIVVGDAYDVEVTELDVTWGLTSRFKVEVDYKIELKVTNEHGETLYLSSNYFIEDLDEHQQLVIEFDYMDASGTDSFTVQDMGYASIELKFYI